MTTSLPPVPLVALARHWQLSDDTTRRLIKELKLPAQRGPWKRSRYGWIDIWKAEGLSLDDMRNPAQHEALAAPLRTTKELAEAYQVTPAAIRNWVESGDLSAIRLGAQYRFRMMDPACADAPDEAKAPQDENIPDPEKGEEIAR
ncbi:MAG: helix-turn-helix domain-containing protein [Rhodovulum sp.]